MIKLFLASSCHEELNLGDVEEAEKGRALV